MNDGVTDRVMFFHTGVHKTGSSALQTYLGINEERLESQGVGYHRPAEAQRDTGNGQSLHQVVHETGPTPEAVDALLELHLGGKQRAICSSEDFTAFGEPEWKLIAESCGRLRIQPKIIVYLRDLAPYYASLHGQLIRSGECHWSFEEFCSNDQIYPVRDSLRALLAVFGRDAITAIHYESNSRNLGGSFMEVVGLSADDYDSSPLQATVNRSLTEFERQLISRISKATGRQYAEDLSRQLVVTRPTLSSKKRIPPEVVEELAARHAADVAWINETFFGGQDVLRIFADPTDDSRSATPTDDVRLSIATDVIDWLAEQLRRAQDESLEFVVGRLRQVDRDQAGHPDIPSDFDPIAYLLRNTDVLKAGRRPYEHFLTSGRHNPGRQWSWED